MARFYRVHLHEYLISQIPAERIHLNKRVVSVNTLEDGVRVAFQDGSEWIGDAVIAADGIHSAVRQAFYPDYRLLTGDHVTLREVFPASRLEGIEGIPKESCHYPGPDRGMFISYLKRDLFTIVAFLDKHLLPPSGSYDKGWGQPVSTIDLVKLYADWHPTLVAIAKATPTIKMYPDYHGPEIPTLVAGDGRVVFIGDAAHPHGGAFAAGGTCSVEDAYTVMRALDHVQQKAQAGRLSREELSDAFDIYNECRYAHTLRVMKAAEAVRAERRANAGRRLSDEEIKENVMKRGYFNWLALNDTEGVFQRVVASRGSMQSTCTII